MRNTNLAKPVLLFKQNFCETKKKRFGNKYLSTPLRWNKRVGKKLKNKMVPSLIRCAVGIARWNVSKTNLKCNILSSVVFEFLIKKVITIWVSFFFIAATLFRFKILNWDSCSWFDNWRQTSFAGGNSNASLVEIGISYNFLRFYIILERNNNA